MPSGLRRQPIKATVKQPKAASSKFVKVKQARFGHRWQD